MYLSDKKTYVFVLILALTACSKHTEYQLIGKDIGDNVIPELENIFGMINYSVKIRVNGNRITLKFKDQFNESRKILVSNIFKKTKEGVKPKTPILFKVIITDKRENLFNRVLKKNEYKRTYNINVTSQPRPALFRISSRNRNLAECRLEMPALSKLPKLTYKLKDLKELSSYQRLLIIQRGINTLTIKTKVLYTAKPTLKSVKGISVRTTNTNLATQLGMRSTSHAKKTYIFYRSGNMPINDYGQDSTDSLFFTGCGIHILKNITPDAQNVLLTPNLSKWLQSYSNEDL